MYSIFSILYRYRYWILQHTLDIYWHCVREWWNFSDLSDVGGAWGVGGAGGWACPLVPAGEPAAALPFPHPRLPLPSHLPRVRTRSPPSYLIVILMLRNTASVLSLRMIITNELEDPILCEIINKINEINVYLLPHKTRLNEGGQ
jgi:hypothetical protein